MCTCIVSSTLQMGRIHTVLMLGVARKLTLRASGGSVSLSSYAQTQLAAPVLDATTRVAAASESGLFDLLMHVASSSSRRAHSDCGCCSEL